MNGRVYDPFLARMISADPTVPGAFNGQAFNRYAYVFNNPLSLVDPSGFGPLGLCGASPRCRPAVDGAGGTDPIYMTVMGEAVCDDDGCPPPGANIGRYQRPPTLGRSLIDFLRGTYLSLRAQTDEPEIPPEIASLDLGLTSENSDTWQPAPVEVDDILAVYIGYTGAGFGAEHAFVIALDVNTGEAWAIRAGPCISDCTTPGGPDVSFLDIYATAGRYDATFVDTPAQTSTVQFVGFVAMDMVSFQNFADSVVSRVNSSGMNYLLFNYNSNSFAFTAVGLLGFSRAPMPNVWVPGWRTCLVGQCRP